ncbi:AAA family ATPase [Fontisphaera persica]|uniref:AAA family ATPase n=1 Tax=Fontisphaera persica TaxID=2974023 RepID=UPI0024C0358D|nr:AAA family ATPase [Fontisphaera persica]WCJ60694.1 AAA family ATPase [Fontisphaera persica]
MIAKATPQFRWPPIDIARHLLANPNLVVPPAIVHGLLHKGTKGVLASSSKAGKTWVLLDLAASIATGTPFLKWPTTQGKVLFVNLEIQRAFIKERLRIIQERKKLDNLDNLEIWTLRGWTMNFEDVQEELIRRAKGEGYSLIVLDPAYKMMIGKSENAASGVGVLCHSLEQVAVDTGALVMFAHHFTKGGQSNKSPMDRMSGSGVFARDADSIITLTEHAEENCYSVEMTLRNLPPQAPFVVQWKFPLMVVREDLDPADLKGVDRGEGNGNPDHLLATPPGMIVPEEESSTTNPSPAATSSTALP